MNINQMVEALTSPPLKPHKKEAVYFIEQEQLDALRRVADRLHMGNDTLRDLGHRMWYVINRVESSQELPDIESVCAGETK